MLSRNSLRAAVATMGILLSAALSNNALGFVDGDVITYPQSMWSNDPTAVGLLQNNYDSVYDSNFGVIEVGIPGTAGFSMQFSGAAFVISYLPSNGTLGPLNSDLIDPTSTSSGAFGGEVLTLQLNIDFSDAGLLPGALGIQFGDLQLRNFPLQSNLNDLTVRQMLGHANKLLGGGSSLFYTISELNEVIHRLDTSFGGGSVSQWAQDHLRVIPIPGDHNGNGTVDAADYVVWRKTDSGNAQGYTDWRDNFGEAAGSGSDASANATVPEPATLVLLIVAAISIRLRLRQTVSECHQLIARETRQKSTVK